MPLDDDLWSRGKCGLKIIQYLSVGVPAVCTPVGINRDIVKDGQNGFWASTPEDWISRLTQLIEDPRPPPEDGASRDGHCGERVFFAVTSEKFLGVLKT